MINVRFASGAVTTLDRAKAEARQAEHADTYGTRIPDRRAFLANVAFVIMALAALAYVIACVINYAAGVDALAHMCAEALSNPGTDAVPARCMP